MGTGAGAETLGWNGEEVREDEQTVEFPILSNVRNLRATTEASDHCNTAIGIT